MSKTMTANTAINILEARRRQFAINLQHAEEEFESAERSYQDSVREYSKDIEDIDSALEVLRRG